MKAFLTKFLVKTFYLSKRSEKYILYCYTLSIKLQANLSLRECVTRLLTSIFFHDSNRYGTLTNWLKYFLILVRFCPDIWIVKDKIVSLWSVHLTAKPKILTPMCHAHHGVKNFELCDWISCWNQNWIWKHFSLFIRGPDEFESWTKLEVENFVMHSL